MDLSHPFGVVTSTVDGDVLVVLAGATNSFTAPEVHQLIGRRSEQGVRRSLERLVDQGIVSSTRVGRTWTYELNRKHLASDYVLGLAQLRSAFMERVRLAVGGWAIKPDLVALFGSAASGQMRTGSDIDLLVVRPTTVDADNSAWHDQLYQLERDITSWTGNAAAILELGADETSPAPDGSRQRVLADIERDGIAIIGQISDLVRTRLS